MPPSSTGHTTARAWCTTPPLPATRVRAAARGQPIPRLLTWRRPGALPLFRVWFYAFIYFHHSANNSDVWRIRPSAPGSSASPRTTHICGLSGDARCAHAAGSWRPMPTARGHGCSPRRRAPRSTPHQRRTGELHLARRQRRRRASGGHYGPPAHQPVAYRDARPTALRRPGSAAPTAFFQRQPAAARPPSLVFVAAAGDRQGIWTAPARRAARDLGQCLGAHRRRAGDRPDAGVGVAFGAAGRGPDATVRGRQRRGTCAGAERVAAAARQPGLGHPTGSRWSAAAVPRRRAAPDARVQRRIRTAQLVVVI